MKIKFKLINIYFENILIETSFLSIILVIKSFNQENTFYFYMTFFLQINGIEFKTIFSTEQKILRNIKKDTVIKIKVFHSLLVSFLIAAVFLINKQRNFKLQNDRQDIKQDIGKT